MNEKVPQWQQSIQFRPSYSSTARLLLCKPKSCEESLTGIDFTQFVDSHSFERHAIYSPVDESLITDQVQYAVEEDVDAAVEAALAAFNGNLGRNSPLLNVVKLCTS